jgi:hypothetical protein
MRFYCYNIHFVQLKTASVSHVNSQSLVLADYGVKTRHCRLCGASLLRFFSGNVPSFTSLETKDTGFATKCENLFASIQYFSMCLAAAEKVLWPIICQLSGNNRPITDYLKNGRLIGFADYLPINGSSLFLATYFIFEKGAQNYKKVRLYSLNFSSIFSHLFHFWKRGTK